MNCFKKRIIHVFNNNSLLKNIATVSSGTLVGQILIILSLPILTRLYTTEDFGRLSLISTLIAIFSVISSLRYELTIPLPKSDKRAKDLTRLSFLICFLFSIVLLIVAILIKVLGINLLSYNIIRGYLWLVPFGVLSAGIYNIYTYYAIRHEYYKEISKTKVYQSITQVLIQLGGYGTNWLFLLVGQIFGQGVGIGSLKKRTGVMLISREYLPYRKLINLFKRYKGFAVFTTPASILNTASSQMPVIILASYFDIKLVGLYAVSHRILSMPISMISKATSQVFLGEFRKTNNDYRKILILINKVVTTLFKIISIPLLIGAIFSPIIIEVVLGSEWKMAGVMITIIIPLYFFRFIISPVSQVLNVLEFQRLQLILDIGRFVLIIISLSIPSIKGYNIYICLLSYSLCMSIYYVFNYYIIKRVVS